MHGLVIGALADLVTSWAICANGDDYLDHSSVSLEVNFLKGCKAGDVVEIDGICDKMGRTLSFTTMRMFMKGGWVEQSRVELPTGSKLTVS